MFDKALLRLPGMKGMYALLMACAFAQAACLIAQTLALAGALTATQQGLDPTTQIPLLVGFFALFALRRIIVFAQGELLDRYAVKRASALRSGVLALAFSDSATLAYKNGTAATALAATEGIEDIERYIRVIPPKLCGIVGISLPILVSLFAVDWVSGVIALVALPVIMLFMVVLGKQARAHAERQFKESQRLSNHFIDMVRGIDTIVSLGAEKRAADSVYTASERMRVSTVRTLSVATLSSAILDLITVFGVAAIAMMLAFRLMDGSMTFQTALIALILAPEFFLPIRSFAGDFHASLDGKNALASILNLLDSEPSAPREPINDAVAAWTAESSIEARNVRFAYEDGTVGLDNVSFTCRGMHRIGILGASGAGKSTLVDIVAGFKGQTDGAFLIDGKETRLTDQAWKSQIHYIPQNPHVFNVSVEENVSFYAKDASRADVERAIAAVGLDELVSDLPQGLQTVLGEGGRSLSGGEAQRIALARMLLDDRPVLLFDEPTAHLDVETELELKQRMLPFMQGKLVFFATHRLHWLSDMDYVIVLDGGTVAEAGKPADLLGSEGALSAFIIAERGEDAA